MGEYSTQREGVFRVVRCIVRTEMNLIIPGSTRPAYVHAGEQPSSLSVMEVVESGDFRGSGDDEESLRAPVFSLDIMRGWVQ